MASDGISLNPSVRDNLRPLQRLTKQIGITSTRLASAKRVNSIGDNPMNFFQARHLVDRATDFNVRLDGMSNSIQSINTAGVGISAMNSLLSSAQAAAESALTSGSAEERRALGEQYNEFLDQAFSIAKDSGFNGTRLLGDRRPMHVELGSGNGDSVLRVDGIDVSSANGTGPTERVVITQAAQASVGSAAAVSSQSSVASTAAVASAGNSPGIASVASQSSTAAIASIASQAAMAGQPSQGNVSGVGSVASVASRPAISSVASMGSVSSVAEQVSIASRAAVSSSGSVASSSTSYTQKYAYTLQTENDVVGIRKHLQGASPQAGEHRVDFGSNNFRGTLSNISREIDDFRSSLSVQEARIATSANIIKVRQTFTEELSNTLEGGADSLVLANLNEEASIMATLKTRSALATHSQALATQHIQQVLSLLM